MSTELLNATEKRKLRNLEKIIDDGLKGFIFVGNALSEISDLKLYRDEYDSFDAYLKDRWMLGRSYAYRLIQGAEVATRIEGVSNEGQARELVRVPYTDQEAVFDRARERAELEDREIIARDIREAATEPSSMTAREVADEVWKDENCSELWDLALEIVDEMKQVTRKLASHPEGCWLQAHADTIDMKIRDVKKLVIHSRPEGSCPMCLGGLQTKCEVCRSRGWLPSARLKNVKKKLQLDEDA